MIKSQWNPEIQGKNIEGRLENQRKTLEAQGRKISALERRKKEAATVVDVRRRAWA